MQVDHDFYLYTKWISQWMMSIYNLIHEGYNYDKEELWLLNILFNYI
jgi:hypothetical protein